MSNYSFFDRDLSWLSFNERVLQEAAHENVPLMERVNFLAIFSSNLDEFYRVRMPVLLAMDKLGQFKETAGPTKDIRIRYKKVTVIYCLMSSYLPALPKR